MFTAAALQNNENTDFSWHPETEAGHTEAPVRGWKLPAIIFCLFTVPVEGTVPAPPGWFPVLPAVPAWAEAPRLSRHGGKHPDRLKKQRRTHLSLWRARGALGESQDFQPAALSGTRRFP